MEKEKIGRNDPCPCNSGKKYKKCCLTKNEDKTRKRLQRDERIVKIDPRIFISEPYMICPVCGKQEFGVLMISGSGYTRRCRSCWHTESFGLPPIKKKLIYLDQFVISNITKALDLSHESHLKVIADPFWLEAFKRLDRLSKYQLIICPDSFYHRHESLVGKDFSKMQRIYEHLSNGVTFFPKDTITRFQIDAHFRNYLDGKPNAPLLLEAENIVFGRFNEWYDRMRVSIKDRAREGEIEELRRIRETSYEGFKVIFERWRKEKGRKFEEWEMEEAVGFGKAVWENFINFSKRSLVVRQKFAQTGKIEIDDVFPPLSNDILHDMMRELHGRKIEGEKAIQKIGGYFNSKHVLQVPTIKITSMLFAAIARKAAAGQVNPPSRGVFTDVNAIASFLPYCAALFVDNENAAYLKEAPLKDEIIKYPAKVFSTSAKSEFLDCLDNILKEADAEHMKMVREVYGDKWGEPFLTILEKCDLAD